MKLFSLILFFHISISFCFSQKIILEERNATFNEGSRNALLVTIPFSSSDFVEKKIKEEVKSWGGKNSSSKGEYTTTQSQIKEMGEKPFDSFVKIVDSKEGNITVAFAFDLGGAFLSSAAHSAQYSAISKKIKDFALNTSKESVNEELKENQSILKAQQKEQESLLKDKNSLENSIVDYKKKIEEAIVKIEKNTQEQAKKQAEIKTQETKVGEVSKKLGEVKL